MEVRILGPTEVVDGGMPLPLPGGRALSLLGILLLRTGEVVSTDRLINELWGETPPATVDTALQGLVSKLRRNLEPNRLAGEPPGILLTRHPGYLLAVGPGQIDAHRFRRLVAEADETSPDRASALLGTALDMWRGPALADFVYEPFAQNEIAQLEDLRLVATEKRIEADLALGRHRDVIGELETLTAEHPMRESLRELLMLALYRSGRQAQALEVFADVRRVLVEELGLDPGPSLQRLEHRILNQDLALDLDVTPPVSATDETHWLPEERKTVTVLSVEVAVSAGEGGDPDAETTRRMLDRFFDEALNVVSGHGATVEKVLGDMLVGIFGAPAAREDDALRAMRAAVDLRHLMAALNQKPPADMRLTARTGIDTGEVVSGATPTDIVGGPVQGARHLQRGAADGEILVGETTRMLMGKAALVESLRPQAIDGYHRHVWRVVDMVPGMSAFPIDIDTPLIGRTHPLDELETAFEKAARERRPHRLTVVGEPGIGKSRLAVELEARLTPRARVLTGHCVAHGEGATFWPLREIVLAAAGRTDRDAVMDLLADEDDSGSIAEHVMGAIGTTDQTPSPGAMFPMLRHFFEALGRRQPVVVILEDLHWAQPSFLDLVDYLTVHTSSALFLVCLARPELVDAHRSWLEGHNASSLTLDPLGGEESRELAMRRTGGRILPTEVIDRVVATAEGNPLFIEQLLATIGEEGDLLVPATVQALLAARIDRLGPAEHDLIRSASVLGDRFRLSALLSLIPDQARRHTRRHLETLERKQLINPPQGDELAFRHVLVQQAAYRSLTKEQRARLHQHAAEWMEGTAQATEPEEAVGYHLEQAFRYRSELGDLDAESRELGLRGGEKLANAGIRAFARFDAAGAENLLSRARLLLPAEHERHWELSFRLAEAHETMGRHRDADSVLSELMMATPDRHTRRVLEMQRVWVRLATGPDPMTLGEITDVATSVLRRSEAAGDEERIARALVVLAEVHRRGGLIREMEETARRGLMYADRSDSARYQLGARRMLATALEVGPTPVNDAAAECEKLSQWRGAENPIGLMVLARLRSMRGEDGPARGLITRAGTLLEEATRARRPLILLRRRSGEVEILAGDLAAAEVHLREALTLGLDMEVRDDTSEVAAQLSRILSSMGKVDEAAETAELARDLSPAESVTPQALWRSARALVHAARGEVEEGVGLVEAAIDLVPDSMPNLRADLHTDLADVLSAAGRAEEAERARHTAKDLYKQKGNLRGARLAGGG